MFSEINKTFILLVLVLVSNYSKAQTGYKNLNIPASVEGSTFFNTDKRNCITPPFGYSNISKQLPVDSVLSAMQDHRGLGNRYALKFDQSINQKQSRNDTRSI